MTVNGKDRMFANDRDAASEALRAHFPEKVTLDGSLPIPSANHDQNCPRPSEVRPNLGEPLTIHGVAELLGCSPWTVRQRYLRQGLPHLRASAGGRIVFFREQVIAWILKRQQQKGGSIR